MPELELKPKVRVNPGVYAAMDSMEVEISFTMSLNQWNELAQDINHQFSKDCRSWNHWLVSPFLKAIIERVAPLRLQATQLCKNAMSIQDA